MIDEWGNEIQENQILSLKEKLYKNRNFIIFLVSVFVLTLVVLQVIPAFFAPKKSVSPTSQITPVQSVTPKTVRRVSREASESAFIELVNKTASLSAEIENEDLYESSLVFPLLDTRVQISEDSKN